jgi:hypothetical protein
VISFACPHCSKHYTLPDHKAGMRAKCRKCRESIVVPAAPAPAPWKADADLASAGTAERSKAPTTAELVLPPVSADDAAVATVPAEATTAVVRPIFFAVQLEFADGPGPMTEETSELYEEARRFLADVLYAYRHRLAPKGTTLKTIRVDEVERAV